MKNTKTELEAMRQKILEKIQEDLEKAARLLAQKVRETPESKETPKIPAARKKAG